MQDEWIECEPMTLYQEKKFERQALKFFSGLIAVAGMVVFFVFVGKGGISWTKLGEDNDNNREVIIAAISAIFSLAGVIMLFLTLREQRTQFERERLESKFFEMIQLHRDNVSELQYTYYQAERKGKQDERVTAIQRKVFKVIFTHFKEAWKEVNHFFEVDEHEIYLSEYLNKLKLNNTLKEREIDLKQYAQIDIVYLIIFYGLSKDDQGLILELVSHKYQNNFVKTVLDFAALKPKVESNYWHEWDMINKQSGRIGAFNYILSEWKENERKFFGKIGRDKGEPIEINFNEDFTKYYGGHQFRLGHYFRHLFQAVRFIDHEQSLSYAEKYAYVRILRGQLSNYEQMLFFLNSISSVGRAWELERKNKTESMIKTNNYLITKYNLIKNIPGELLDGQIKLTKYYPYVKYESRPDKEIDNKRSELQFS